MASGKRLSFSKTRLESLTPPDSGRVYHYDTMAPGLAVCITSAGSKTFYFRAKVHGQATRTRLGRFPNVTVEQARKLARKLVAKVAEGIDPAALKRAHRDQGIWYLPGQKSKSGIPLAIVLPPPAVEILRARRQGADGNPWVFPADSASGHISPARSRTTTSSGCGSWTTATRYGRFSRRTGGNSHTRK